MANKVDDSPFGGRDDLLGDHDDPSDEYVLLDPRIATSRSRLEEITDEYLAMPAGEANKYALPEAITTGMPEVRLSWWNKIGVFLNAVDKIIPSGNSFRETYRRLAEKKRKKLMQQAKEKKYELIQAQGKETLAFADRLINIVRRQNDTYHSLYYRCLEELDSLASVQDRLTQRKEELDAIIQEGEKILDERSKEEMHHYISCVEGDKMMQEAVAKYKKDFPGSDDLDVVAYIVRHSRTQTRRIDFNLGKVDSVIEGCANKRDFFMQQCEESKLANEEAEEFRHMVHYLLSRLTYEFVQSYQQNPNDKMQQLAVDLYRKTSDCFLAGGRGEALQEMRQNLRSQVKRHRELRASYQEVGQDDPFEALEQQDQVHLLPPTKDDS